MYDTYMFDSPLQAGLWLAGAGLVLELFAALVTMRSVRRFGYGGALILTCFGVAAVLASDLTLVTILVAVVASYRVINSLRVLSGRQHERRTLRVTKQSSFYLAFYQLIVLWIWYVSDRHALTPEEWLLGLLAAACFVAVLVLLMTRRSLDKASIRSSDRYVPAMELPTVSVCIPARNETSDLPACLSSILASEYPKLEVLVLDDCSQDKTSEVIKGLAQKGVRFIKGEEPKNGWLAKNQAYQQLAEAATGDVLLFCGVDVRLGRHDIHTLVSSMTARHKQMISILPKGLQVREHAGLVQPMRYWWELALPRRFFNRPPVLSTCWLIRRDALLALGGFKAVDNAVIPEGYFARELATTDGYSFMRAGSKLHLSSVKQFDQQWETAIRVRYPQLRKRPEMVLITALAEIWFLLLPLVVFIAGFFVPLSYIWLLAGLASICLLLTHFLIIKAWSLHGYMLPLFIFPIAVLSDLAILHYSMWRYEFGTVTWKERNICIPVMRTYRRLPPA